MENLTKLEVLSKIENSGYKFAWINTFSDLKLIELRENNKFKDSYLENLIEAKIFNENKELSIIPYEDDEKFSVVEFDGIDKDYIEEKQVLYKNKSPLKGENDKLVIRNYLDYDNEGQAFVDYTKLCGIEGGKGNEKQQSK
ncbi:hypothetical protein EXM36_01975 [Clostridium botulinum]|uniref:hypothetical protein n=1 Tax=Clostridium botulinum TaxID=1491 RepID=UPI0013760E34|nr:hypothetical protein [Clostridium botulinum]NCI18773.1 hypothetical protein [Clostridium botulinum]NCI34472.1 hypothetical protein [Clostridium botulinum]NCI73163.1 hypothetical protein [Clostridium botulinum]NDI37401.1 hypothetical protein [Clostridium botulinum]NEZ70395.1 hypothetical protein [Clostridium botulinum]